MPQTNTPTPERGQVFVPLPVYNAWDNPTSVTQRIDLSHEGIVNSRAAVADLWATAFEAMQHGTQDHPRNRRNALLLQETHRQLATWLAVRAEQRPELASAFLSALYQRSNSTRKFDDPDQATFRSSLAEALSREFGDPADQDWVVPEPTMAANRATVDAARRDSARILDSPKASQLHGQEQLNLGVFGQFLQARPADTEAAGQGAGLAAAELLDAARKLGATSHLTALAADGVAEDGPTLPSKPNRPDRPGQSYWQGAKSLPI